jgi:hypothetical protein
MILSVTTGNGILPSDEAYKSGDQFRLAGEYPSLVVFALRNLDVPPPMVKPGQN